LQSSVRWGEFCVKIEANPSDARRNVLAIVEANSVRRSRHHVVGQGRPAVVARDG